MVWLALPSGHCRLCMRLLHWATTSLGYAWPRSHVAKTRGGLGSIPWGSVPVGGGFPLPPKNFRPTHMECGNPLAPIGSILLFPGVGVGSQNSNQNCSVDLEGAHLEPASDPPSAWRSRDEGWSYFSQQMVHLALLCASWSILKELFWYPKAYGVFMLIRNFVTDGLV